MGGSRLNGDTATGAGFSALITALARAHAEGRLDDRLAFYAKPKLLVVDELGFLPFEPNAAHLFFRLVKQRPTH